jgi:hypothetical protein
MRAIINVMVADSTKSVSVAVVGIDTLIVRGDLWTGEGAKVAITAVGRDQ